MPNSVKYNKSWAFTSAWEGGWDGEKKPFTTTTNDVATYGITPGFLTQQVGMSTSIVTKAYMRKLTKAQASDIWFKTRWQWFKCERINDADLAVLVWDMAVRKPKIAYNAIAYVVGLSEKSGTAYCQPDVTVPSDEAIRLLNEMDAEAAYKALITFYIVAEPDLTATGVIRRKACLYAKRFDLNTNNFNDFETEKMVKAAIKAAKAAMAKSKSKLAKDAVEDETPQYGKWVLGTLAFWGGGKFLKWW